LWRDALADAGMTLEQTFREIGEDEELPWEVVSYKIPRDYFLKERHKAYQAGETDECKHVRCTACGVCDFQAMHNLLAAPVETPKPAPATGLLQGVPGTRVRLRYSKGAEVRFISHLDTLRELERAFRRSELPVLYSEGFSPRPRIGAGHPLPLGWTSDSEWIDVELAGDWPADRLEFLLATLNASVAPGIAFSVATALPPATTSLGASLAQAEFVARLPQPAFQTTLGELEGAVQGFLASDRVVVRRERRGHGSDSRGRQPQEKVYRDVDIRPLVYELAVLAPDTVSLTVAAGGDGSVKPTDVLGAALGLDPGRLPLIQIHKRAATLAGGEDPAAAGVTRVEVNAIETGDPDRWEPARDARGYSGG
jgi:radical SAM-linked protein